MPPSTDGYRPDPRHTALGSDFYDEVEAADFSQHTLRFRNDRWSERIGLGDLDADAWLRHFAKFEPLRDNLERPLALRYHGHQFQSYNPDLGDGRGFLFAQLRDAEDRLLDLATKGSGTTPWSRGGDGRLTLKGGVREVLATAQLEALGVYTSKSLSLVETGESLERHDEPSPTRSSVLVRLSHSHVRFGTFQRQAFEDRSDNLEKLVEYCIATYFPALAAHDGPDRTAALLGEVVGNTARLAASWMVAGFVHGVLNTDNMNVTGESFDYGPYRFLPSHDPNFTAAYFDHSGLYAYGRQHEVAVWNLYRLAEALLPICDKDWLVPVLETFDTLFQRAYCDSMVWRLGLTPAARGDDGEPTTAERDLAQSVQLFLHESQIGFEQLFFDWYGGAASRERAARSPAAALYAGETFASLLAALERFDPARPEALGASYFDAERPCTLLVDEIEALWSDIAERDDWRRFETKLLEIEGMRQALGEGWNRPPVGGRDRIRGG